MSQVYGTELEDPNDLPSCYPLAFQCRSSGDFRNGNCFDCKECSCALVGAEFQIEHRNIIESFYPRRVYRPEEYTSNSIVVEGNFTNYYTLMSEAAPYCGMSIKHNREQL